MPAAKGKKPHSHNAKKEPPRKSAGVPEHNGFFEGELPFFAVVVSAEIGGNHIIRPPVLAVDGSKTVVEKRRWMFGTPAALATREFPFL